MQLFCVVFLHPLHRNSFRAKKNLKKSVKKFGLYCFLYYICNIRKIKKLLTIKNKNKMEYTAKQIENAKRNYNARMRLHTLADYNVEVIGMDTAVQMMEYHNGIVTAIRNGDKELEREWKLFYLELEVEEDRKKAERKAKLAANKAASADILEPIKKMRKLGEFGKWLNTPGNPFRKQHFNKKYTVEAVNEFLKTL